MTNNTAIPTNYNKHTTLEHKPEMRKHPYQCTRDQILMEIPPSQYQNLELYPHGKHDQHHFINTHNLITEVNVATTTMTYMRL